MDTFDFSTALHRLKEGKAVARKNWNAGGQFIYHVPADSYIPTTEIGKQIKGENGLVEYTAYLAIKTVQGTVAPWLASQTDMLADDWVEVDLDEL